MFKLKIVYFGTWCQLSSAWSNG